MFTPRLPPQNLVGGIDRDAVVPCQRRLGGTGSKPRTHLINRYPGHHSLGVMFTTGEGSAIKIVVGACVPTKVRRNEAALSSVATGMATLCSWRSRTVVPLADKLMYPSTLDAGIPVGVPGVGPRCWTRCRHRRQRSEQVPQRLAALSSAGVAHTQVWHTACPGR